MAKRKWEYQVHSNAMYVGLPENRQGPEMDCRDMEDWLNHMDSYGWEFVGSGQKNWIGSDSFTQNWWVFRKPYKKG